MTAIKTLIFTILVPGTVGVWVPISILGGSGARGSLPIDGLRYVGLSAMLVGASIYLWCAWDFTFAGNGTPAPIDPPKKLVVGGLYRYVRNPMYVGVLSLVLGEAAWYESRQLFAYAALVFVSFFAIVVFYEEPALKRKFGDSYVRYRAVVPRWIPRPRARPTKPRV